MQQQQQMLQMQAIKTPEQYFQVINTGRVDVMFEGEQSELMLIKAENEKMAAGQPVSALAIDRHDIHIKEHKSVLADPDLRDDPTLVTAVLNHIQQHIDLLRNTDIDLLGLTGNQILQNPNQMPQPNQPQMNQEQMANSQMTEMTQSQIPAQIPNVQEMMPQIPRAAGNPNLPVTAAENAPA